MGAWNYRLIDFGTHIALHEVHYDAGGNPRAYTADPATFVADIDEGPAGITGGLEMALNDARERPVLKVADLPRTKREIDPGDPMVRHEALDRASLLAGTFEREVLDHPAVQGDPALKAVAERALGALGDLYQAAGQPFVKPG